LNRLFYFIKPLIPRAVQLEIRRRLAATKRKRCNDIWPIDLSAAAPPAGWRCWPEGKRFALVLSHDVDTDVGVKKVKQLAEIMSGLGLRSSFNFVPERYAITEKLRQYLVENGFEIGVHGLVHDGKLFSSRQVFENRAKRINYYLKQWNAVGFHAPSMHRNMKWIHEFHIEYSKSTFDTDPFEPQPDGIRTIFPVFFPTHSSNGGYVELPYTLPQDHALFIIMRERDISIWKKKLDWVATRGGMALLNTHPDYMNFSQKRLPLEEYPVSYYTAFLEYIQTKYRDQYWHVLPREMARFWRQTMVFSESMQPDGEAD